MDDIMPFSFKSAMPPVHPGEKHIACVILVDVSGSMMNSMDELHRGLAEFGAALKQDEQASGCADVSVISFGNQVDTVIPFCPAAAYNPPRLQAGGMTCMNGAIIMGLNLIEERKKLYRTHGIPYYRPWLFLLTDGTPTDTELESQAKQMLQAHISKKKVTFFPMGIGNADTARLKTYAGGSNPILRASQDNFREAFIWLAASVSQISNSFNATKVDLVAPPPMITIEI